MFCARDPSTLRIGACITYPAHWVLCALSCAICGDRLCEIQRRLTFFFGRDALVDEVEDDCDGDEHHEDEVEDDADGDLLASYRHRVELRAWSAALRAGLRVPTRRARLRLGAQNQGSRPARLGAGHPAGSGARLARVAVGGRQPRYGALAVVATRFPFGRQRRHC